MRIGIIGGSVRDQRKSDTIARWVLEKATQRGDADYVYIDLREFNVPILTSGTHPMMAKRQYESDEVTAWSEAVDACDAYVFVTPEYNHAVPGAFKNAVDTLGPEWVGKAVAFIGYGSVGGSRAIENWRLIVANFQMVDVRAEVNLNTFFDFDGDTFAPLDRRTEEVSALFDALLKTANKLQD